MGIITITSLFSQFVKSNIVDDKGGKCGIPWCRGEGVGRKGFFFSLHKFTMLYSPPVASRTCDLEAKQIKKKKTTTNNMQVSKFSSFRVYCRKRGKTDKLKISKASSWFSILLLSLHLLFLILFLLSLLFVLFLLSF